MRKTILLPFLSSLVLTCFAAAQGTRTWEQTRFEEFERGTAKGVAITSDGALELAPQFKILAITPSSYLWSMGADNDGNVFVAAGAPARVYRVAPNGTATVVLEPQELQVQALAVAPNGTVFAATSPDGRVYRIDRNAAPRTGKSTKGGGAQTSPPTVADTAQGPAGGQARDTAQADAQQTVPGEERPRILPRDPEYTSSVYFEPKTKYIWSLALDTAGNLFVATGDRGEIYKVDAATHQGSVFFKSDEAHIRVLAFGPTGSLFAGSDGSGLIYRISPAGDGFVLYSAPKKEITALAIDEVTGNIYAAGVGEKRAAGAPSPGPSPIPVNQPAGAAQTPGAASAPIGLSPAQMAQVGGSEVYQIAPDGSPRRLWSSREEIVYALMFDPSRHLIAGTGNKGKVFTITGEDQFTALLRASATQVTAFAKGLNGARYVATSNLGKIFALGPGPETEGSYTSDVFDAKIFSRWGRAEVRGTGGFQLSARSGNVDNPDRNWSPWTAVALDRDLPLEIPPARFIQWKAVLVSGRVQPRIESVGINYLAKNVAPHVDDVSVQVGHKYAQQPRTLGENSQTFSNTSASGPTVPNSTRDRDFIAVHWTSHDDNDDTLSYSVYYQGDGETRWKLLKDHLLDRFYSFDSDLLPDGGYKMRVIATDAPSHTPEQALTDEQISSRFEVDNTPPRIDNLAAINEGNLIHVTFRAQDNFSSIRHAEVSVDAGEWQMIEPVGQISDARLENYDFNVPLHDGAHTSADEPAETNAKSRKPTRGKSSGAQPAPAPAAGTADQEHLVVVRVSDKYENTATAKVIARSSIPPR
jgi:hypothetical protein